ncbi:MAG: 2-oxoacid:acceptor oxidoreductase family protein [Deltaproteobacteria bacterium]|nr:2-oxoacid:acceptor oxidoreductase family protein [Deltaproteobacteria bacterium]
MLTRIRFGGLGGQGIVMAGSLLGEAATLAGLHAAGSNSYGAAARGTACRSDVVLSDVRIAYPHVSTADVLAVMSQAALDKYLPGLVPGGVVFADDFSLQRTPEGKFAFHAVPATHTAVREFGSRQGANIVLLGVVLGATGAVGRAAVEEAIRHVVRARFHETNLRALALGFELGRPLAAGGRS